MFISSPVGLYGSGIEGGRADDIDPRLRFASLSLATLSFDPSMPMPCTDREQLTKAEFYETRRHAS